MDERHDYEPAVSVIVPIRGIDEKIKESIGAILNQGYPKSKHEVIFVVDPDDADTEKRLKMLLGRRKNARIIQSVPLSTCAGKNSAVITGVKHARYEVLAFADSDIIMKKDWLRNIVAPLSEKDMGVATGYRFYVPENFVSYVLSAWNNIGLAQMGTGRVFVWGGSFAIKKSMLKRLGILKRWAYSISEDSIVTENVRKANLKIRFVPQCIVKSHMSKKYSHPLEFTTRQVTVVRWYWHKTYKVALLLFILGRFYIMLGIVLLLFYASTNSPIFLLESLLFLWTIMFGLLKASIEFRNLQKLAGARGSRLEYAIADFFAQWLMTYNLVRAGFTNSITWRGRTYMLKRNSTSAFKD